VACTNDRLVGPLAASFALIAISEVTRPVRWLIAPLGLWLLVAPWLFGAQWSELVNSTTVGVLMVLLAPIRGAVRHRYGGGWAALWLLHPSNPRT
jgi:hypothetical protein